MALSAEIDESSLQAWFHPGDLALVDVGFFLQTGAVFDVQVVQALPVDQRYAQLFGLSCID